MPVKPAVRLTAAMHQPFWGPMNEEDEAHSLISAVDRSLADCIILLAKVHDAGISFSLVSMAFFNGDVISHCTFPWKLCGGGNMHGLSLVGFE